MKKKSLKERIKLLLKFNKDPKLAMSPELFKKALQFELDREK